MPLSIHPGVFQLSNDFLKISCRMGESSSCNVHAMGFNLSGPTALCGFKPSAEMLMSWGKDWAGRGGQHRRHADPFGQGT